LARDRSRGALQPRLRYYDPALGRWTQRDPVQRWADPKSWNPYVYVGQKCTHFTGPTGAHWWNPLDYVTS
jgi:RHS repeat-associated protein